MKKTLIRIYSVMLYLALLIPSILIAINSLIHWIITGKDTLTSYIIWLEFKVMKPIFTEAKPCSALIQKGFSGRVSMSDIEWMEKEITSLRIKSSA